MAEKEKRRVIQETVPGRQITLAHVIPHPVQDIYAKIGLSEIHEGAIGILTVTPSEAAIIAGDVASKSAGVRIGFVDRFNGSLIITGDVAAVQAALKDVMRVLCGQMGYRPAAITDS